MGRSGGSHASDEAGGGRSSSLGTRSGCLARNLCGRWHSSARDEGVLGPPRHAQVGARVLAARVFFEHLLPLCRGVACAAQSVVGDSELHGRGEKVRVRPQNPSELLRGLVGQPALAQRYAEAMTDVMKVRATIERLAVGLDRVPELAHLSVGVAKRGLKVRELAPRGRIDEPLARRKASRRRGRHLFGQGTGAFELAPLLIHRYQRESRLGVAGVDADGPLETLRGALEVAAALMEQTHHVVDVGEALARLEQPGQVSEGALEVATFEACAAELILLALV